jgi:hypothetical protein
LLQGLTADSYTVIIDHDRFASTSVHARIAVEGGQRDLGVISLEPAGAVSGDVVDRFGSRVIGAEVTTGDPPDWGSSVRTDSRGSFRLRGLSAGEHRLSARAGSAGTSEPLSPRVRAGEETSGLVLRLPGAADEPDPPADGQTNRGPAHPTDTPADPPTQASTEPPSPGAGGAVKLRQGVAVSLGYANSAIRIEAVHGARAREAGLRVGDAILEIEGEAMLAVAQARSVLRGDSGTTVRIKIGRDRTRLDLTVPRESYPR